MSVRTPEALGTGFVVHPDGWIVTSLHVVGHGPEIVVTFEDGRELPVIEVINGSRQHDLVILRVAAKGLPTLALGDSDRVRAGDSVVAIGHPLGLSDTVSNGLVSAVRQLDSDLEVLQISAPIAPGSSGGPLFNEHGEVIGIATAILQGGQNLNLGLPAKYVKRLMQTPEPISMPAFVAAMTQGDHEKQVPRHVPNHPVKLLRGCSSDNLSTISQSLGAAIDVG
ncbi:MAG TPA: trypsin-like peptidase domain-containing protein, partial [Polyangiaceae bacterium]|nr:trypsin-like peptidase domain-containing protein [Polyangiaceae bacterium]